MKLDPVLKKAWIANLRSGKFKQIFGSYRASNGYCVLGCLSQTIRDLGFSKATSNAIAVDFIDKKQGDMLIQMNDKLQIDFPQLASYIERNENI